MNVVKVEQLPIVGRTILAIAVLAILCQNYFKRQKSGNFWLNCTKTLQIIS